MKLEIVVTILFFIYSTNAFSICNNNLRNRIARYNELLECKYYITSENVYRDFLKIKTPTFYSLSRDMIKFRLSATDNTDDALDFVIGESIGSYDLRRQMSVKSRGNILKTLTKPGMIRDDQPNKISFKISEDNHVRITINDDIEFSFKLEEFDAKKLNNISFAANNDNSFEEFFYNCKDSSNDGPILAVSDISPEYLKLA